MSQAKEIGFTGEALAQDYLLSQNYKILEKNYHTRFAEIDIVGEDQGVLAFVEVKYYQQGSLRGLYEAVDQAKQKKMISAAEKYIFEHKLTKKYVRFDVVLIEHNQQNKVNKIDLIKDAFRA